MTLEEAKKILEKEFAVISLHESTEPFEFDESGWIGHEKPSVPEAFRVLSKGGYYISISGHDYNMREKRLKKEYEGNTRAPGSSSGNRIREDSGVNPALAESASRFNDALLDEQGKKIKRKTRGCCGLVAENEDLIGELKKKLAEKDGVIAGLGNELAATRKELEEKTRLVETVRKGSEEYCEYGIPAEKMIRKMANGYRYNPQLYDFIEEEEKKFSPVKDTHPTGDNPEEIEIEKAVRIVRKAMKEGHTVTIKYEN